MDSFNYTTIDGDRIDILAVKFYGNVSGISIISDANPDVPLEAIFPLGTVLIIPIIKQVMTDKTNTLPPWKR